MALGGEIKVAGTRVNLVDRPISLIAMIRDFSVEIIYLGGPQCVRRYVSKGQQEVRHLRKRYGSFFTVNSAKDSTPYSQNDCNAGRNHICCSSKSAVFWAC